MFLASEYFLRGIIRHIIPSRISNLILTEVDFPIITKPLGRVAMCRVDVLKRDREMNEEQIEIVDSPELKLPFRNRLDLEMYDMNFKL